MQAHTGGGSSSQLLPIPEDASQERYSAGSAARMPAASIAQLPRASDASAPSLQEVNRSLETLQGTMANMRSSFRRPGVTGDNLRLATLCNRLADFVLA